MVIGLLQLSIPQKFEIKLYSNFWHLNSLQVKLAV